MKAENQEQRDVERLRGQLHAPTMDQFNWILGQDYERASEQYAERKKKVEHWDYYSLVTAVNEWQVVRYYLVNSKISRNGYTFCYIHEVSQRWMKLNEDGHLSLHIFELKKHMNWQWHNQPYSFGEPLSLKYWDTSYNRGGRTEFFMDDCEVVPDRVFAQPFVDAGLDKAMGRYDEICLYKNRNIANGVSIELCQEKVKELTRPCYLPTRAETLYKIGETALAETYITSEWLSRLIDRYWASFLIARRNGLRNIDWLLWFDYVRDLERLGRDIHSPKYLCPNDIGEAHGKIIDRLTAIADMEELERNMKEIQDYEPKYRKQKRLYFGITIVTESGITITTAQSVRDIYEEGKHMHHCVFRMGYYKHTDDLILFARGKDGERIETIRVNLEKLTVAESRGVCNKATEWHNEIVKAMEDNMWMISDAMKMAA